MVSSQPVPRPTRTQVNPYSGCQVVSAMKKPTRNQLLGYDFTYTFKWKRSTVTLDKFYPIPLFLIESILLNGIQCTRSTRTQQYD